MENLNDQDWAYLRELVLERAGVLLPDDTSSTTLGRLDPILAEFHLLEPGMLIQLVREAGESSPLSDRIVGHLIDSDTFFFRDSSSFEYIRYDALPKLIARNMDSRSLRIWCGGCSTGQEVYSVAVMPRKVLPHMSKREYRPSKVNEVNFGKFEHCALYYCICYNDVELCDSTLWLFFA